MFRKLVLNIQKFANPTIPTSGTHELVERYPSEIKALFRKSNNLRQYAGRDYEGSPKAGAVKIPVRDTEVVVGDYDILAGKSIDNSTTIYLNVPVNKNKAINELVDGFEASAVPDDLRAQRLRSGAYILQRTQELDYIASIRDSVTANDAGGGQTTPANPTYETSTTAISASDAYSSISTSIGALLDEGVDPADIKVGVTTEVEGFLLEDVKFTNTASELGSERVMRGVIGMIRGAEVIRSSNLGVVSATGANVAFNGNTVEYVVFSPLWSQTGDEWMVEPQFKDLTNEFIGSSALQGREIYFNALTDSKGSRVKTKL